jgi:hypothetical protein
MSVCVYSVFVLSCVLSCLATGLIPVQGVLATVNKILISELMLNDNSPDSRFRQERSRLSFDCATRSDNGK